MSHFWLELFRDAGIPLKFSLAYHPKINEQIKVVNQTLEIYFRCYCFEQQKTWVKWLPWQSIGTTQRITGLLK